MVQSWPWDSQIAVKKQRTISAQASKGGGQANKVFITILSTAPTGTTEGIFNKEREGVKNVTERHLRKSLQQALSFTNSTCFCDYNKLL